MTENQTVLCWIAKEVDRPNYVNITKSDKTMKFTIRGNAVHEKVNHTSEKGDYLSLISNPHSTISFEVPENEISYPQAIQKEIEVGDVVTLKSNFSDEYLMTVCEVWKSSESVVVMWFNLDGKLERSEIKLKALQIIA